MVPHNKTETGSTKPKETATGLRKRFVGKKLVKRPKNMTPGVDINTCAYSSPTGS